MAGMTGRNEVRQFIAAIPAQMEKILRGAGRTAARVIADEARLRCISSEVREAIKLQTEVDEGVRVIARVVVKGRGAFIAPWLEYGTDPHFISVADDQRKGLSVRTINERVKAGSLVINGKFVGETVFHPGARPNPFLRPALDVKEADARAAAQNYINARVSKAGINAAGETSGDQ